MEPQTNQRRVWEIDKRLEALVGCAVRVRAEVVMPKRWNGESLPHAIGQKNLILPDGTSVDRDPIYVEGGVERIQADRCRGVRKSGVSAGGRDSRRPDQLPRQDGGHSARTGHGPTRPPLFCGNDSDRREVLLDSSWLDESSTRTRLGVNLFRSKASE